MEEREERALRLKRLKRKRAFTMVALVAVLGLLGGGYWVITDRKAKLAAEEAQKKAEQEAARNQKTVITSFLLNEVSAAEFTNEERRRSIPGKKNFVSKGRRQKKRDTSFKKEGV